MQCHRKAPSSRQLFTHQTSLRYSQPLGPRARCHFGALKPMDFIVLLAKVLAATCLLGLAGGFATLPFREGRRVVVLLTPMFRLLILPLGVAVMYSSNRLSFQGSAIIAMFACAALTILAFVHRRPTRD